MHSYNEKVLNFVNIHMTKKVSISSTVILRKVECRQQSYEEKSLNVVNSHMIKKVLMSSTDPFNSTKYLKLNSMPLTQPISLNLHPLAFNSTH